MKIGEIEKIWEVEPLVIPEPEPVREEPVQPVEPFEPAEPVEPVTDPEPAEPEPAIP
ncbi:MAG: hypothetical protein ACT4OP_05870 [Actinomycetota bacterium]